MRCWCGRPVATLPGGDGWQCAEHDDPVEPEDLDELYGCALCDEPLDDPDDVFCPDCLDALNSTTASTAAAARSTRPASTAATTTASSPTGAPRPRTSAPSSASPPGAADGPAYPPGYPAVDDRAPCRRGDPGRFFPPAGRNARQLKPVLDECREACPFTDACAEWGLRHEAYGIWGGTTAKQRSVERKRLGIVLDIPHAGPRAQVAMRIAEQARRAS